VEIGIGDRRDGGDLVHGFPFREQAWREPRILALNQAIA
jgi:hypothetical protein